MNLETVPHWHWELLVIFITSHSTFSSLSPQSLRYQCKEYSSPLKQSSCLPPPDLHPDMATSVTTSSPLQISAPILNNPPTQPGELPPTDKLQLAQLCFLNVSQSSTEVCGCQTRMLLEALCPLAISSSSGYSKCGQVEGVMKTQEGWRKSRRVKSCGRLHCQAEVGRGSRRMALCAHQRGSSSSLGQFNREWLVRLTLANWGSFLQS